MMRGIPPILAILTIGIVAATGCNKKADDAGNYKSAINSYYDAHPECLFKTEKKFPVQADTKDSSETMPWDALVDQGLLVRTTAEKTKLIVMSKSVNNYDLSDKGRGTWKADPQMPGYGNFCFGRRKVEKITNYTPVGGTQPGVVTTVNYTYTVSDVADWARSAGIQTAYPGVKAKLAAASSATANLVLTGNGWQLQKAAAANGPDGSVVE